MAYPFSWNAKNVWESSLHQNPTGQVVVVLMAGFAMTMAIRFGLCGLTWFGFWRLTGRGYDNGWLE